MDAQQTPCMRRAKTQTQGPEKRIEWARPIEPSQNHFASLLEEKTKS